MATASILALDVGEKRVGVAIASLAARLPRPLTTLERTEDFWSDLADIINTQEVQQLVVGYPRGLSGQTTAQTTSTEAFIDQLRQRLAVPITLQDEALTSQKAEAELGKRDKSFVPSDIDALAATYILEDYLANHPGRN